MWRDKLFSFPPGRIYPLILVVKADTFPGFLGLINDYVDTLQINEMTMGEIICGKVNMFGIPTR